MQQPETWGKYMRVDVPRRFNPATAEPENVNPEVINLDLVARVFVGRNMTAIFELSNGSVIPTTTHFEVAATALMLSQGPRPPMTREELASDGDCEPIFLDGFRGQ